jgi:hypothetical protein
MNIKIIGKCMGTLVEQKKLGLGLSEGILARFYIV